MLGRIAIVFVVALGLAIVAVAWISALPSAKADPPILFRSTPTGFPTVVPVSTPEGRSRRGVAEAAECPPPGSAPTSFKLPDEADTEPVVIRDVNIGSCTSVDFVIDPAKLSVSGGGANEMGAVVNQSVVLSCEWDAHLVLAGQSLYDISVLEPFTLGDFSQIVYWAPQPSIAQGVTLLGSSLGWQSGSPSSMTYPFTYFSPGIVSSVWVNARSSVQFGRKGIDFTEWGFSLDSEVQSPALGSYCSGSFSSTKTTIFEQAGAAVVNLLGNMWGCAWGGFWNC